MVTVCDKHDKTAWAKDGVVSAIGSKEAAEVEMKEEWEEEVVDEEE